MTNNRESNYELMRIILMFMVLFWHYIINIVFSHNMTSTSHLLWTTLNFFLIVHIDVFVILTGYFSSRKGNIGITKILKLNNLAYFYKIVFLIIFLVFGLKSFSSLELFRIIQPITLFEQYWFIAIYLLLYLVSPYLNKLLNVINKKQFQKFILVLFLISSLLPVITNGLLISNQRGHSLLNFILLYTIGAYLYKYPLKDTRLFSGLTKSVRKSSCFLIYCFLAVLNLLVFYFSQPLEATNNQLLVELSSIINNAKYVYHNPITIIAAVFFFLYFSEIKLKSKFINYISVGVLDVYLIHDNQLFREFIYKWLEKYIGNTLFSSISIVYGFLICLLTFVVCIFIGLLRKYLFDFVNKRKIIIKIKRYLKNRLNSFGFEITW